MQGGMNMLRKTLVVLTVGVCVLGGDSNPDA